MNWSVLRNDTETSGTHGIKPIASQKIAQQLIVSPLTCWYNILRQSIKLKYIDGPKIMPIYRPPNWSALRNDTETSRKETVYMHLGAK